MNTEETLALWAQGKEAWNAWANEMLDRRAAMEREGIWAAKRSFLGSEESGNEATADWMAVAGTDFSGHVFETAVDFTGVLFPGPANFSEATFQRDARFDSATFSRDARFFSATFSGDAGFVSTTFSGDAGFNSATFSGSAGFYSATFSGDAWFNGTTFSVDAGFDRATFSGDAWFVSTTFSGDAGFDGTTFSEDVRFVSATFSGDAGFDSTTFSRHALFDNATFSGSAEFDSTTFSGSARFDGATFSGDARFAQAKFGGYTSFSKATVKRHADFSAAHGERAFTLEGASFAEVPDFIQAHFSEAPRLDNVRVSPGRPNVNRSARYRALKRLAIAGHDHVREQEYFAGELKSLRGCPDRLLPNPLNWLHRDEVGRRLPAWPGGARYWFGLGYQLLSDFGRSMLRPLGWWFLATAWFAWAYLAVASSADRCAAGPGTPWSAALGLSIRKALPFAGIASAEKLNQIYACLYGIHGQTSATRELPERFTPVIPDAVDYLGMVQLVLSLLLLFLFLLAVRSHFRIR